MPLFKLSLMFMLGFLILMVNGAPSKPNDFQFNSSDSNTKTDGILKQSVLGTGCDFLKCNEYCQRMGKAGGHCVGDACYCNHFEVQSKDKQTSESEISLAQKSNSKPKNQHNIDGCENSECILYCQRMGKAGGHCVGDSCYCFGLETQTKDKQSSENKLLSAQKTDPKINDFSKKPVPYDGCETSECILYCQRMGKAGGYCLEDACYCLGLEAQSKDKKLSENETPLAQKSNSKSNSFMEKPVSYDGCETSECILYCQRMGKAGGHCLGDACYCFGSEAQLENKQLSGNKLPSAQKSDSKPKNQHYIDGCETSECILYCQRLGKAEGHCLGDSCYCFGLEAQSKDEQLSESSSAQKTN